MGLDQDVKDLITTAKAEFADLSPKVGVEVYLAQTHGVVTYKSKVYKNAIVEKRRRMFRTQNGQEVQSQHFLLFLEPIILTMLDRLTLPDGSTGPILSVTGLVSKSTGKPYYAEVYLG